MNNTTIFTYSDNSTSTTTNSVISSADISSQKTLVKVEIGSNVTAIANYTFVGKYNLNTVIFNTNIITYIGISAFNGCIGLQNIILPESITYIADWAFLKCRSLPSINIPAAVTQIGTAAFGECDNLINISASSNNSNYSSIDGVLYDKTGSSIIQCPAGKSGIFNIPVGVISVGGFLGCTKLTEIIIPDGVVTIRPGAFQNCSLLTTLKFPSSITFLNSYVFSGCTNLINVLFFGNAPTFDDFALSNSNSNLIIYRYSDKTGWPASPGLIQNRKVVIKVNNICDRINYFKNSLISNQLDSGYLCGCYNLNNPISGIIVQNYLYNLQNQYYVSGNSFYLNEDLNVGVLSSSGQEKFDETRSFKILNNLTGEKFSLFLDFEIIDDNRNSPREFFILKSNNPSSANNFTFSLEMNKYNDLFLKYNSSIDGISYNTVNKSNLSLDSNNLLGINISDSKIFLSKFNFYTDEILIENYNLNLSGKKDISFGKFSGVGFSGNLNNLLLYKDLFDLNYNREIFKTFLKTGEREELQAVISPIASGKITGYLNPTGILGTGITGYTTYYKNSIINNDLNLDVKSFSSSGITGFLTGEKIEYSGTIANLSTTQKYIYNVYDLNESKKYTKNNILFINPDINDLDFVEIQIYPAFSSLEKTNLIGTGAFLLNKPSDRNNIYVNGIYSNYNLSNNLGYLSGIESVDISDSLYNLKIFNNFQKLNNYHVLYNSQNYQNSGSWTLLPTDLNLTGKYNVYLNGLKLTLNLDYKIQYSNFNNKNQLYVDINQDFGDINIVEDNFLNTITGLFVNIKNNINYITGRKIIFINGILQNLNQDYIEYSHKNIGETFYAGSNINTIKIFENEYSRFNK